VTLSVAIAEAICPAGFRKRDIVTDLINARKPVSREARKRGGNEIVSLEMAKI